MAYRGTLSHRKNRRLANVLGIPWCYSLGILEALWHITADRAPQGDIGRLSDQDIADEMFFPGDSKALIDALVTAGWLDRDDTYRLLVHDWHVYAPQTVTRLLARKNLSFLTDLSMPSNVHTQLDLASSDLAASSSVQSQLDITSHGLPTKPNQTKPNQTSVWAAPPPCIAHTPGSAHTEVNGLSMHEQPPSAASTSPSDAQSSGPYVFLFPCTGKKTFGVTTEMMEAYRERYPNVELTPTLMKAREYLLAEPRKQRLPKSMPRWLDNWIAQEKIEIKKSNAFGDALQKFNQRKDTDAKK